MIDLILIALFALVVAMIFWDVKVSNREKIARNKFIDEIEKSITKSKTKK